MVKVNYSRIIKRDLPRLHCVQYNTQESKRNMNNIKTGKDNNTYNESSDDEKSTGDNKKSFELGKMFTATRKANNKMVKKVTTQDHRIIN